MATVKRRLQFLIPLVLSGLAIVLFGARAADASVPPANVEIMLVVDTSGSMRVAMEAAKTAANEFIASMPASVPIGVETFGSSVTVLTSPTLDRALLVEQINGIVANGDTSLYDAVVTASQQFTPGIENPVLVLLSDGKDEGSSATLDDAIAAVQGLHVEAISLTTPETDINSLSALGPVTSADDAAGMSAAFARVASLLAAVVEPTVSAPVTTVAAPTTTVAVPVTTVAAQPTPATTATQVAIEPPAPLPTASAPPSSSRLWLGAIGTFVGLFLLGLLLFPRERVSKARLGIDKPRTVSDMGKRTVSAVEEALERHGMRDELATALVVADISMKPAEFVAMVAVVALVAGLVGLLFGGFLVALGVALFVCLAVRLYVRRTKAKRQAAFADQLPDVLQLVTTALRSGYGLTQALESVAEEAEEPARSDVAHVLVEARLGRDLSESMRALGQRMESKDLDWVVSAIDINRETGGNLSEILQTVSTTIRERQRMARHVRTLTAEGRMSARILTALPLVMTLWQWRVNPDHFELLLHGAGLVCFIVAGILMLLGAAWVRKVVNSVVL
jgi:Flp pilus assembly protein TadB